MKTEISRDSFQPTKRYSGVYQQQGRMLTDADWNELVEILKARVREALKDVVGNAEGSVGGTPRHRALKLLESVSETFEIQPGQVYVDGVAAELPGDAAVLMSGQPDFPAAPAAPDDCTVYVDVWERTVTHLMDERLRDKGLHGADTCTRKQMMAQVKWCDATLDPESSPTNPVKGDALLSLTLKQKTTDFDPCDPCAAQLSVESNVGNYLFRVEVHDVTGDADDPETLTLKWSTENGAEAFEALASKEEMPAGFIGDKFVYEFFDQTSEKHLGVHLADGTWTPSRGVIKEIVEPTSPYAVPTIPGSSETRVFVRRWDGYCTIDLATGALVAGTDKGVSLSTSKAADTPGYVSLDASLLHVVLSSLSLELALDGASFVAGDYWLADVREAEHDPLDPLKSKLIEDALPTGIAHHCLTLGSVSAGALQPNPETDRKYAFPSLTEMTRLFHVGGDGQEAMPGLEAPQSLEVGVANGEWPVEGALVAFVVEAGDGTITNAAATPFDTGGLIVTTDAAGTAACRWQLGDASSGPQRVVARLVTPDSAPPTTVNFLSHPPIVFNANLSTADQVAYEAPTCADGASTVNALLGADLAPDWPDFDGDGNVTVKDMLDAILCKLKAKHIPYTPDDATSRWTDILESSANLPQTVQDAIDQLVEHLEASDIRYALPSCETTDYGVATFKALIEEYIAVEAGETDPKIQALWNAVLCHLDAKHLPYDALIKLDLWEALSTDGRWTNLPADFAISAEWLKHFGGAEADYIRGVAVDADGNVVITGTFSGTINFGGGILNAHGESTAFLVKLNRNGEHEWSTAVELTSQLGSSGQAVVFDSDQNIVLTVAATLPGEDGATVNRIEIFNYSTGGFRQWTAGLSGDEIGMGYSVAVDSQDDVVVSGFFQGTIRSVSDDALRLNSMGAGDIFLAKLNGENGDVRWLNGFGGAAFDVGYKLQVDSGDNIVLTGVFENTINFGGAHGQLTSQGKGDGFVAKFDGEGICLWARGFGGAKSDYGRALALDEDDDIYVTGYFQDEIRFDDAAEPLVSSDGYDGYLAKFSSDGAYVWSRGFGGTQSDYGHDLTITTHGAVALVGFFSGSADFGGGDIESQGETDAFVAMYQPDDGRHLFSDSIGASGADQSTRVAAGPNDSLFIAGMYRGTIAIAGTELESAGESDIFVLGIHPPYNAPTTIQAAIDDLIEYIKQSENRCTLPSCDTTDYGVATFKKLIEDYIVIESGETDPKTQALWNALLCRLDAKRVPYDALLRSSLWGSLSTEGTWRNLPEDYTFEAAWLKRFGGAAADYIRGVAVDSEGNVAITGRFTGTINFGGATLDSKDVPAGFLVKLTPDGSHAWSTAIALDGQRESSGQSLAIDRDDNIVLSWDAATQDASGGALNHILVHKYSAEGEPLWTTGFTGNDTGIGYTVAIDSRNDVVVSGFFQGAMQYIREDLLQLKSRGDGDIFLAKFDARTGDAQWAVRFGGSSFDVAHKVGIDSNDNIVLTGFFNSSIQFGDDVGVLTSKGKSDIFVAKFDPKGVCLWAHGFGGAISDYGRGLTLDENDNIYLTGYFQEEIRFSDSARPLRSRGGYDIYLAKFTGAGTYVWSRALSGPKSNYGHDVAMTTSGAVAMVGFFSGTIDLGGGDIESQGETDAFMALFDPDDGAHLFSETIGAAEADQSTRIAAGANDSLVIAGMYRGTVTISGQDLESEGESDIFVVGVHPPYNAPGTVQVAIDQILDAVSGYVRESGAQTITGSLTIDDGAARLAPVPSTLLEVGGKIKASSFEGDGSALTGISGGIWSEGASNQIYYNAGNVGIGTANPTRPLEIFDSLPSLKLNGHATSSAWQMLINGNGLTFYRESGGGHDLRIDNDGNIHMPNGNVGVQTSLPRYTLHTNGTSYAVTRAGGGLDYAEYFESSDGSAISPGTAVTIDNGKVRPANDGDVPIGVVSANPVVAGGVHPEWPKKFLRDAFGRLLTETYQEEVMTPKVARMTRERQKSTKETVTEELTRTEVVFENGKHCRKQITETVTKEIDAPLFEEVDLYDAAGETVIGTHRVPVMESIEEAIAVMDENGEPVLVGTGEFVTKERPRLNPEYDAAKEYIPREQRPEWNCVGLLGQLPVRNGQPAAPTWIKLRELGEDLALWLIK